MHVLGFEGFLRPRFPAVVCRLKKVIEDQRFDIVQTFFEDAMLLGAIGAACSRFKPVMVSSRRDIGLGTFRTWYHPIYSAIQPWISRRFFQRVVTNCGNIQKMIVEQEGISLDRVKVIPNGISLPQVPEPIPAVFKEASADFWIGMTANLTPVKRVDVFLDALAYLEKICPNLRFRAVLLGEGVLKGKLIRQADSLGIRPRVHFIGAVRNVVAYLQNVHVGVLSSDREGMSNAIMEYMSCGLPVVATAVGGSPELVDASMGVCVPPGDPESVGRALGLLCEDPALRLSMGRNSLRRIKDSYSWEKTILGFENYYQELVGCSHLMECP
jgi:glycosyltransferase involved in cell wall biosynthesis